MTEIEGLAFCGCTGLTSVDIGNSVTKIGDHAFEDCISLKNIVIPDSVTEIEEGVFRGCTGLTSIVFQKSVKKIGEYAFENCVGLKVINVPAKKADYYKKRLPEELHSLIMELPTEKKAKK